MAETCENCASFDNSKFLHHTATRDAGMCTKFTEITFKRDKCKFHLPKQALSENEIFVPLVDVSKLPVIQFDLFN
nr:hypothetical protein [uncultured Flavobacterium sp.]